VAVGRQLILRGPDAAADDEVDLRDPSAGVASDATPLLGHSGVYEERWNVIQTSFVDEPRHAVQNADGFVTEAMEDLARIIVSTTIPGGGSTTVPGGGTTVPGGGIGGPGGGNAGGGAGVGGGANNLNGATARTTGTLARTGTHLAATAIAGLLAVALGSAALVAARRRTSHTPA
jgi:hypothetical protein